MSDELGITAQGLETVLRTNMREDLARLAGIANERGISLFLIGNPIRMDGSEGAQSDWVRQFATKLATYTGLPFRLWDERLTTVEAERVLRDSGVSLEKRRRAVDRMAAVILLESYLAFLPVEGAGLEPTE